MLSRYRSQYLPVAGLVFSIIGFIYSLVMSFGIGAEAICLTSGCSIVQDFRMFGISPWWLSCLGFAVMALLCFFRMRLAARLVAAFFLAGDCVFLLIMFFVAPCTTCLIGGFIIFCTWMGLHIDRAVLITARRIMARALSATWVLLFLLNLGYAANEAVPAWKIGDMQTENNKISIFFSPSCPACREAIGLFSGRAAFHPVAEAEGDYLIIADMAARVKEGASVPGALEAILAQEAAGTYTPPKLSLWDSICNKIKIMRNQAAVLRHGQSSLPVLVFEGLPAAWAGQAPAVENVKQPEAGQPASEAPAVEAPEQAAPKQPEIEQPEAGQPEGEKAAPVPPAITEPAPMPEQGQGSPDLPPGLSPDFNETLECGRNAPVPCDEAQSPAPQNTVPQ